MSAQKSKSLIKYHIQVALIIAVWLTVFLIIIAPFDAAELSLSARLKIMPIYGVIVFFAYMVLIPFQNWAYKKIQTPSVYFEVLIIVLFNVLGLLGSFIYYNSSIVNGDYSFLSFTFEIYYPIFFILLPIIIFARWFISRKVVRNVSEKIILRGDNKLDILQIAEQDLICVSSADNYVTVAYLIHGELNKKLLRTTLKNIEGQLPQLVKTHRSHLINPSHFASWKDANTLLLTQIEVPVSKNYKKEILRMIHSPLKTNTSPLT